MTFSVTLLAWIADEVVLALLQVSFLGKCDELSQLRVLVASENVRFISSEVHIFIAPYKIHAKL